MTNIRTQGVCALLVAGVLFFGAPAQALTVDAQLESLWKQVAELQRQIAELKAVPVEKKAEPMIAAAVVATSTATSTLKTWNTCTKKKVQGKRETILVC